MSICIQYSRPASSKNDNEVFGFDVAVTRLMSAYFRCADTPQFICRPTDIPSFEHFKALAAAEGIDAEKRCIGLDPRHPDKNLESLSCLFRPDPLTADLMWRRLQMRGRGYATCGVVHTMSGERIARAVSDLCFAPSDDSDALICPSVAIRDAVKNLWDIYSAYIDSRFGGKFSCPVQTPIIPLGIDTQKFSSLSTPEKRRAQREALNATDDEVIILFVGRLSFAIKAHPLPMFMAAERAAKKAKKKIRLVLFGYFLPKEMENYFRTLAADICKTVKVDFVMNDDPRFPDGLWAAADIFTSLSDNMQESFGLTPIEAMASGLPAVVTDWDGYREGVRNGQEGYLIPTLTPPPSAGMAIAQMYYNQDNYGMAMAGISQSTYVDFESCAEVYATLADNAPLRQMLGMQGRKRAQEVFDWKHIIKRYGDLWKSLSDRRLTKSPVLRAPEDWPAMHPGYPNMLEMFKGFPTRHLAPEDVVRVAMTDAEIAALLSNDMNLFIPELLLPRDRLLELIARIRLAGPVKINDILISFPHEARDLLWRCFGWMLKCGVCVFVRG